VFVVVSVYFVIDSVRKLLDTPSYDTRMLRGISGFTRPEINREWREIMRSFSLLDIGSLVLHFDCK
jgi:hypothetical protein